MKKEWSLNLNRGIWEATSEKLISKTFTELKMVVITNIILDYLVKILRVFSILVSLSSQNLIFNKHDNAQESPHSCASLRPKSEIFFSDFTTETTPIIVEDVLEAQITFSKVFFYDAQSITVDSRF